MSHSLQLDKMSTAEKLIAMEELWQELSKNAVSVSVPNWHRELLQ